MFSGLYFLVIGFFIGIGVMYFVVRPKTIHLDRLDERVLLLRLPFLGTIEAEEPDGYRGFFSKSVLETLGKLKLFQELIDVDVLLHYAHDYNVNYIGIEGDMKGACSKGRLAYNTLSRGYYGGYNIYLNPGLDREAVSTRLSRESGVEITPDELYTFLFLHEIGHTMKAGNKSYVTALVNHSLSGGRRSTKRRRA